MKQIFKSKNSEVSKHIKILGVCVTSGSWSFGMFCAEWKKNKGKQWWKWQNNGKQHFMISQDRTDLLHVGIQFCKQQNTPNKDIMTINENYAHNISSK